MKPPDGYVDPAYLDTAARMLASVKQRTHELMRLAPGMRMLDVGCGPGTDTIPMAQRVGASGQVCGVDFDASMVAMARERARTTGVAGWTLHTHASAAALPFAADYFDACRCERVLLHTPNDAQVVAEMTRVTCSGGWVVAAETDWGALSIDHPETDVERRLARFKAEQSVQNGFAGRRLYRLFRQLGLQAVELAVFAFPLTDYITARYLIRLDYIEDGALAAGVITADELHRWRAALQAAAEAGVFFSTLSIITAAGRKA